MLALSGALDNINVVIPAVKPLLFHPVILAKMALGSMPLVVEVLRLT
jgi:hypothetical protein